MARGSSNLGHYSLPSGGMLPSSGAGAGAGAGYNNSSQYLRQNSLSNQASNAYPALPSRHVYSSNYGSSFEPDPFDPYTMSAGQYLMPLQDLQTSSSGYAAPDSSRHWTPIPNNRGTVGGPNFDTESAIRCGTSAFPLMNSSGSSASSVATDGSSAFPTMGSLVTSLPSHPANVNRTLPNPTSKKVSRDSISLVSQGTLNEPSVTTNITPNLNYRSSVSWDHDHAASGGTGASTTSTSVSTATAADRANSKPSTPPRGSQDTTSYGSISLPPNSFTTNNVPSISEYMSNNSAESTNSDNYLGTTAYSAGLSGDTVLSSQSCSSLYGYQVGSGIGSGIGSGTRSSSITESMPSEGVLVGGLPYNLPTPQSQLTASFETSNRSSLESSRPTHRTSISSANNARY
ncbi:hypothetical protein MMC22_004514 [Lobaria immixta]|nr:hypothetical protein [Lobaria immixta]